MNIKTFKE